MSWSLLIKPAAENDLAQALAWYERQRERLGDQFLQSYEETLERIIQNPLIFADIHQGIRRAQFRKFPYGIFYVISGEQIAIIAVVHAKRHPRQWRKRR